MFERWFLAAPLCLAVVIGLAVAPSIAQAAPRLVCNEFWKSGMGAADTIRPSHCMILKACDSLAQGVRLGHVRWSRWGEVASARGDVLPWHPQMEGATTTPARVKLWRPIADRRGTNNRYYSRMTLWTQYGKFRLYPIAQSTHHPTC